MWAWVVGIVVALMLLAVAAVVVLGLLARSALARRWRQRLLDTDAQRREALVPINPWQPGYRRVWRSPSGATQEQAKADEAPR
ncbi:MAG: hypothetical protein SV108_01285 [Pseudomonadota bacterium]|nr:hypothetical protein [Pseudomonadota bacterium]HJO36121.1 hypothetical protein [Gammaproteobacteria bacterium]